VTINGDVTFKRGARIYSAVNRTETLVIGGNLLATTPVSFFTEIPGSAASTTVNFTKAGTATVSGAPFNFRNLSVGASTVLQVNSAMNIAGTIGLNTTGQIDASNGEIGFVSYPTAALAQTVTAGTFKDGLIRDFVIDNTAGVTLNQNLSITNMLTMQAGILSLPAGVGSPAAPVTLQINGANAIVGTFGSTTHISTGTDPSGSMAMVQLNNANTQRTLPLGNSGNYLPVTINPSVISSFTASVFTPATDNGTPNGTATADKTNIVDAIYNINRIAGTGNTTLTLGFPASLKGSGFASIQNNQLGISRFNGTAWETPLGNGDNTQNFATATFANFSPFRVEVNLNPTLPVKLGDITATKASGKVQVSWRVYNELNVAKYVVERSTDGFTYKPVGFVTANGSSSYSFTDATPAAGKNLYRLRSVDKDNANSLSKIVLVDLGSLVKSLSVSPNPVSGGYFTVRFSNLNAGKVSVRLFNNVGQIVMDQPVEYNGSSDNQLINLPSKISRGVYQLLITDGLNTQKTSIVVQ